MIGDIDLSGNSRSLCSGGYSQTMIAIGGGNYSLRSFCGQQGKNLVAGRAKLK